MGVRTTGLGLDHAYPCFRDLGEGDDDDMMMIMMATYLMVLMITFLLSTWPYGHIGDGFIWVIVTLKQRQIVMTNLILNIPIDV